MGFVHKIVNWQTGVLATNDNTKRTLRANEQAVSNTFHYYILVTNLMH